MSKKVLVISTSLRNGQERVVGGRLMKLFKNQSLVLLVILCVFALSGCNENASYTPNSIAAISQEVSLESENVSQNVEQGSSSEFTKDNFILLESLSEDLAKGIVSSETSVSFLTDIGAEKEETDEMITVLVSAHGKAFSAKFHNNALAKAIASQMPFTLDMSDFLGQEKVASLRFDLPNATTETPSTIGPGEIYLWSENQLVLFYTTFSNSYSYVPIGYIEDVAGLIEALGSGSVAITFSLA